MIPLFLQFLFLIGVVSFGHSAAKDYSFHWSHLSSNDSKMEDLPASLENVPETVLVPSGKGYKLTAENVQEWFLREIGPALNKNLRNSHCIAVSKVETTAGKSMQGAIADQVFFISASKVCRDLKEADRPLFVLKHYKSDPKAQEEVEQLLALKKDFSTVKFNNNMPKIVFSEFFYKYRNHDPDWRLEKFPSEYRYISLIHPAKGKSLWSILDSYVKEKNVWRKRSFRRDLLQACDKFGTVLANFHLEFMRGKECPYRKYSSKLGNLKPNITTCYTKIHGDLHFKNVFWDGKNIYFIDIATLTNVSHELNFVEELAYTFAMLVGFSDGLYARSPVKEQEERKNLISEVYSNFLMAYLKVYQSKMGEKKYVDFVAFLKEGWIPRMAMFTLGNSAAGDIAKGSWAEIEGKL